MNLEILGIQNLRKFNWDLFEFWTPVGCQKDFNSAFWTFGCQPNLNEITDHLNVDKNEILLSEFFKVEIITIQFSEPPEINFKLVNFLEI